MNARRQEVLRATKEQLYYKPAIHEAGHAVIAAYLKMPLRTATIKSRKGDSGHISFIGITNWLILDSIESLNYFPRRQLQSERLNQYAIVAAAGRAAEEEFEFLDRAEECYKRDEASLAWISEYLCCGNFDKWREEILEKARAIMHIPYVKTAIEITALDLQFEYAYYNKGIPAKQVRLALRLASASYDDPQNSLSEDGFSENGTM
jgi:hypothetical protein